MMQPPVGGISQDEADFPQDESALSKGKGWFSCGVGGGGARIRSGSADTERERGYGAESCVRSRARVRLPGECKRVSAASAICVHNGVAAVDAGV